MKLKKLLSIFYKLAAGSVLHAQKRSADNSRSDAVFATCFD